MVPRFVKCLGAGDGATFDIGLARSVERRGGFRIGFALGVSLYRASAGDEAAPQRTVGRWGRPPGWVSRAGFLAGVGDLHGARAAIRSAAAAEHAGTGRGDEEAHMSAPPNRFTR